MAGEDGLFGDHFARKCLALPFDLHLFLYRNFTDCFDVFESFSRGFFGREDWCIESPDGVQYLALGMLAG